MYCKADIKKLKKIKILGDFNEDIVHHHNSAILPLMSSFSFQQLVQCPTTAQGTLIDHVYYRNTSGSTVMKTLYTIITQQFCHLCQVSVSNSLCNAQQQLKAH